MRFLSVLLLNKEARLFDTKEFILKAFIAVVAAVFIGRAIPYVSKDMISLLFGMLLTLDPVNLTGLRSGFKQVEATILGALVTGLILALLGYTPWSLALAIAATLYVSLLINWREFSVVAVFTSIYMGQFVQTDAAGNPSEVRTFMLRIAALLTGVVIAFVVNYLFSVFGYRHMLEKRVYHLMDDLHNKLNQLLALLDGNDIVAVEGLMATFPALFNNIDWIYGTTIDFDKDPLVKRSQGKQIKLEKIVKMNKLIREMTHISYDLCYKLTKGDKRIVDEAAVSHIRRSAQSLVVLMENMDHIIHNKMAEGQVNFGADVCEIEEIRQFDENIVHINELLKHY